MSKYELQVDLFLNDQLDGNGVTSHRQSTTISPESNSRPLTAGVDLTLDDVITTLDLYGQDCASLPYVCLTLSKNSLASPDFTLSHTTPLVYCDPIPCEGNHLCVILTSIFTDKSNGCIRKSKGSPYVSVTSIGMEHHFKDRNKSNI